MADVPSLTSEPTGSNGRGQRAVQEEPLDAILSPELDKMVTDGAILSKLYNIPELEGKDVEELFTVLSPSSTGTRQTEQNTTHTAGKTLPHTPGVFPRLPVMNGLMGAGPHFPTTPIMPSVAQGPAGFRMPPPDGNRDRKLSQPGETRSVPGAPAAPRPPPAPLRPRAEGAQKARDNRAAQRINKVQLSNDSLKRHQPPQPPPGPYDPVSMETEAAFKDPLRPK
uniref:histone-lysine N-methyltransferase 2C-like n=1 Tax=Centroberyx gerrardi TaxID=166262 RepID=UPI003AAC9E06